ncbi:hypothetical protein NX059_011432 [Plenodomus lindquistii]|nr:hypothetical protein NX059_011432 [Plenodomus lindquistii]
MRAFIAPEAQKSCRLLCDRVCSLPRELRDSIYAFVHPHETVPVASDYLDPSAQPRGIDGTSHYWDKNYVGEQVQREMVESWYRTTLFHFKYGSHYTMRFFNFDRWQLGINPRNYVRKVKFEVIINSQADDTRVYDTETRTMRRVYLEPLDYLQTIPDRVFIILRVHNYAGYQITRTTLYSSLDYLHRHFNALGNTGHKFIVEWASYGNLQFTEKDCASSKEVWVERLEAAQE